MAHIDQGEFPPSIGNVARRELAAHGITRFDQLPQYSSAELLAIHGVGQKAMRILTEELTARGLALKVFPTFAEPDDASSITLALVNDHRDPFVLTPLSGSRTP